MDIIISHDVDHLYLKEHLADTFIPGAVLRGAKSIAGGGLSFSSFRQRFSLQLNRIRELHEYNRSLNIRETFFFGMRKGLNLSYNWKDAAPFIEYLLKEDVLVGLHGQGYNNEELLQEEKNRLLSLLPENYPLGIRNHYLRKDEHTFALMNKLGFLYDSTEYSLSMPSKTGQMWEIPISIMDAGFVSHHKNDHSALKDRTLTILNKAHQEGIPFFVINFHDVLFNEGYPDFRSWYLWITNYLSEHRYKFVNFTDALKILNIPS